MAKKQELNWMWIIGILLIGILLFKYNQPFLIIDHPSLLYSNLSTFGSYNIVYKSTKTIGYSNDLWKELDSGGNVANSIDRQYTNNFNQLGINLLSSRVCSGVDIGTNNPLESYTSILYTTNLNIIPSNLLKLQFDFNKISEMSGCQIDYTNTLCRFNGGNSQIYLVNLNNQSDYLLIYNGESLYDLNTNTPNLLKKNDNGRITLEPSQGIFNLNVKGVITQIYNLTGQYELLIKTQTSEFTNTNRNSISEIEKFEITNLVVENKNVSVCYPKTCSQLNKQCGLQDNGCGTIITCGQCNNSSYCDNSGQCNLIPLSCSSQGKCADANGSCITCPTPTNCSDWGLCEDSNGNCITCSNDTACTQDVKQCSDGSYVSRNSTINCDFNKCPEEKFNWKWPLIGLIALIIGIIAYIYWRKDKW